MIRPARPQDAAPIAAIYAPEVLGGTATFEIEAPDATEMLFRLARVQDRGWPWLVAQVDDEVAGFSYASQFRDRAAYAHTCESTIYVAAAHHRAGVGRALLEALIDAAHAADFREMIAAIGDSRNQASIGLHRACGFADAGRLVNVGHKFGRWLDVVYMQRSL